MSDEKVCVPNGIFVVLNVLFAITMMILIWVLCEYIDQSRQINYVTSVEYHAELDKDRQYILSVGESSEVVKIKVVDLEKRIAALESSSSATTTTKAPVGDVSVPRSEPQKIDK